MKKIESLFAFSRKERWLMLTIIVLILGAILLPFMLKKYNPTPVVQYQVLAPAPAAKKWEQGSNYRTNNAAKMDWKLHPFNLNSVTEQELLAMGFREKLAHTLINYRNKGGRFYKWSDVEKIYGLRPDELVAIKPYVIFSAGREEKFANRSFFKPIEKININTATQEQWETLPGIGSYFAARIIKFRTVKGGFTSIDQVGKTYGLSEETFQKILPYLVLDSTAATKTSKLTTNPRLVNINTASEKQLLQVPHMEEAVAKAIIIYRQKSGPFSSVTDIKRIPFVTETAWQLVSPYLTAD